METLSDIAIIILNYNNYMLTIDAIENICHFTQDVTIVVVDNYSPNESWVKLNEYHNSHKIEKLYLIRNEKNTGYASGNNFGIQFVRSQLNIDYIIIMNPDIKIRNVEMLYKMKQILYTNDSIGAITVQTIFNDKIYYPNDCCWKFSTRKQLAFGNAIFGKFFKNSDLYTCFHVDKGFALVDVVQGCFFMIKLSTLSKVNDFDPNTFLYCEEAILAKKLLKLGFRNAVLPDYYIEHNHIVKKKNLMTYKSIVFDMKCMYKSKKYYIKKYSGYNILVKVCAYLDLFLGYSLKKFIRIFYRK